MKIFWTVFHLDIKFVYFCVQWVARQCSNEETKKEGRKQEKRITIANNLLDLSTICLWMFLVVRKKDINRKFNIKIKIIFHSTTRRLQKSERRENIIATLLRVFWGRQNLLNNFLCFEYTERLKCIICGCSVCGQRRLGGKMSKENLKNCIKKSNTF